MWKCSSCQEEIEDKYKHCWNCGSPRPATVEPVVRYKRVEELSKPVIASIPMVKVEPIVEKRPEPKPKIVVVQEKTEPKIENPTKPKPIVQDDFLSVYGGNLNENPPSIIWTIVPVFLWLIVTGAVAYFAVLSNQKTTNFDNQILADGQNFNAQKSNFNFPTTALPDRKNKLTVEGNIKGKVLPLNKASNDVAELFYNLPDDLRPTNLDEVKTIFWLDCKPEVIGKGNNGAVRSQEKCNTFLVDREAAKFIGIQEFLGVSPTLTNDRENVELVGKVLPERYLTYLREKQIETERGEMKSPSDSPNHHIYNKSELVYAIGLLCVLGAIGLGWLAFKVKSMFSD